MHNTQNNIFVIIHKTLYKLRIVFISYKHSENLDNQGNIIQHVQPINQPIVPSGGTNKIINDNIEKLQHESRHPDESQVLTNMTLCFFTGDDILKSHLMFNDRWRFDRYNLKGLKTYVNDLTFGANIHLGKFRS